MVDEFSPVTPGEILRDEFLLEYGLSQGQLARAIGISPNRIAEIVNNRRRISADTAVRLGRYFGNSAQFWLDLQSQHDIAVVNRERGSEIAKQVRPADSACV